MNARGDAMIVYGTKAVRRAAGTTRRSKAETVAAVPAGTSGIRIDRVALGGVGDAIVTFESYVTRCGRRSCYSGSYVLYAAREGAAGAGFTLSAPITSTPLPLTEHHDNRAVLDANGVALIAYEDVDPSGARLLRSVMQPRGTAQWSAPVTVYTHPYQQAHALSASVDANSLASVLFFDVASSTYAVVDGNLRTTIWATPVALSSSDPTAQPGGVTASNGVGGLVLGWTSGNGAIQAMLRPRSGAAWTPMQTVAPYDPTCSPSCTIVNAAAINDG